MLIMLMANIDTLKVCPTSAVRPTAKVIAIRPSKMGRPAATTAPKTMSRMMRAIGTPMPSPLLQVGLRRAG